MSDLFSRFKSGATKVAAEAEKAARVAKAQTELASLKHRLDALYAELGKAVYDLQKKNEGDPAALDGMMQKITEQLQAIEDKNQAIQAIQAEGTVPAASPVPAATPVAAAAGAAPALGPKFCPNCGHEMPVSTKFCPECGSKVA